MSAIKEHSNQIIKILICLCLTFVFIFVQPKENVQQAEAIVPILLWGGGILAGVVAEELLEMGVKHATGAGKTSKKSTAKKIADEMLGNLDYYDFDDMSPKRKADGTLEVNLSPNDRAKIARKIADEFGDIIDEDLSRNTTSTRPYVNDSPSGDPLYGTGINVLFQPFGSQTADLKGTDYIQKMYDVRFTPSSFESKTTVAFVSNVTGSTYFSCKFVANNSTVSFYGYWASTYVTTSALNRTGAEACTDKRVNHTDYTAIYYNKMLQVKETMGSEIYTARGLVVPKTIKNVYPVGGGYDGDDLPNRQELSNKPYKIKNFFPSSESDSDVTWNDVQNHYDTDSVTNQTKIDNEYETYLENGDLNNITNTYNTQTINNYYTDSNYPVKSNDENLLIKIDIDIPPPAVIDDDDSTTSGGLTKVDVDVDGFKHCVDKSTNTVVPCKDIEGIDGGLLAYLRDSYNYAVNAVKTAVNGLETIATGSVGLIALYSEIFDWLPDEVTVLLTSGLMLMIGLRVFRK